MNRCGALVCFVFLLLPLSPKAQEVSFTPRPLGYIAGKVHLGAGNYASALAADPEDDNHVYVAGMFEGVEKIVRLDLRDGAKTSVFAAPTTVSVNGFAVASRHLIFVSDNVNDHLLALVDDNPQDGDFNDPGEIRELLEPILTHPTWGWTGTRVCVVPDGPNRLGLPTGSVLFQSEDGETTQGEVLAVVNPLTSPSYQPPGGAYFSGFDYGGGIAIDSQGRLLVASSFYPDTGKVWICEDVSGDGTIGEGESNIIVERASDTTEWAGLSSLVLDADDRCYISVGWGFGSTANTEIRSFALPEDPLNTTATVATFATLNTPYVSAMVLTSREKTFKPYSPDGATLVIAAYDQFYGTLDYLLTLKPFGSLGVRRWTLY